MSRRRVAAALVLHRVVGRILRQPFTKRLDGHPELNESYMFCLKQTALEAAGQVKKALEDEGYEGEAESLVRSEGGSGSRGKLLDIPIRESFSRLYGTPFKGKVYLPRFCVKDGKEYRPLDYYLDLVSRVDVDDFKYGAIDWSLAEELAKAKDRFQRVTIGSDAERVSEADADLVESDSQVLAWMVASLRFDFLSHKQLRAVARRVYERLIASHLFPMVKDRLALVKFVVRNKSEEFIQSQVDLLTERAFGGLFDAGRVLFYLQCREYNFELPPSIRVEPKDAFKPMLRDDGKHVAKSLFEQAPEEGQNEYERQIALVLDDHPEVLWWFRNRVGRDQFMIQGYRKDRIYPDFVVQGRINGKKHHRVLVVESKGAHLLGNPDTDYKRRVTGYFDKAGHKVSWQKLGSEFKDHVFRFQVLDEAGPHGRGWKDELLALLAKAE